MRKLLILAALLAGCAVDSEPLPTCASLGAPINLTCTRAGLCHFNGEACERDEPGKDAGSGSDVATGSADGSDEDAGSDAAE